MMAVDAYYGRSLASTNAGATWLSYTNLPPTFGRNDWPAIAASADGSKLVWLDPSHYEILVSTNSGANWTASQSYSEGTPNVWQIASSADGATFVVANESYTYVSTNSGASWMKSSFPFPHNSYISVTSSANGRKLVAAAQPGGIYTLQPPSLTMTAAGTNAIISWPSLSSGGIFTLQANSDLTKPTWTNVVGAPIIVITGRCHVLVPATATRSFFRLISP
jgi:hypothetical protein